MLIKEALRIEKGSGEPNREKVGRLTRDQVRQIAEAKMPDLNARDVDQAMKVDCRHRPIDGSGDRPVTRHGKNYRNARATFDREELYSPAAGDPAAEGLRDAKFDQSVEIHFNLGLNVRHAEQQLRGTLMLPHGTGREARVAVFAEGDKAKEAQEAGADVVGTADLAQADRGRLRRLRRRRSPRPTRWASSASSAASSARAGRCRTRRRER